MESPYAPLSESCAKLLSDKTYEKRKAAAQEIEKTVYEFNKTNNVAQIRRLLKVLTQEFTTSREPHKRKGGLIGLAATSIGLARDSDKYINELIEPILTCLIDPETRVRYFANESLYNVVKVARGSIVPLFPEIFAALSRMVTDSDQSVKNGSELLDRLLKEIVTENAATFDLDAFVPMLRDRIYTNNSFARQFVISWVSALHSVPQINLIVHLPEILDGLFQMLEDKMVEIHRMCETLLQQFLGSIRKNSGAADMPRMSNILIGHAQSATELIQFTAITWIREFVQLSGSQMLSFASGIFTAILPCLAYTSDAQKNIKDCATAVNLNMMELVAATDKKQHVFAHLDLDSVMEVLRQYLGDPSVETRVAALKWILHLFIEARDEMSSHADSLFAVLLTMLSDSSDEVVLQSLDVLAEIVSSNQDKDTELNQIRYRKFVKSLLNQFNDDKHFREVRGSLIIRKLCVKLKAETIFRTFAEHLSADSVNIRFASVMVRVLHTILVTSAELFELRCQLKDIRQPGAAALFECLYRCWAHCPVSTLSLCLLAQCYQHVSALVVIFADLEITVEFLAEVDKLVQMIESPIFASLRLTLVSPQHNRSSAKHLAQALFGILMLLPQTSAFALLKNRLQCVPNYWDLPADSENNASIEGQSSVDFGALLVHFQLVQQTHQEYRIRQRRRNVPHWETG